MVAIYKYLSEAKAQAYGLVLASAAISYQLSRNWLGWSVWVNAAEADESLDILELYIEENQGAVHPDPLAESSAKWGRQGVWGALVLLVIHIAIYRGRSSGLFFHSLGASSTDILQGEFYRSVTALMIHASHLHLASNLVGIILFGSAVCSLTGWGTGWLLITLSGIFGNLLNAAFKGAGHLSVGASTAIFGAIGILAALQFLRRLRSTGNGFQALLPLGGGLALLAILGSGAHTDRMAHLFGFLLGCVGGFFYGIWIKRPVSNKYQLFCLVLTIGILTGAWIIAPVAPGF